MIPILDLKPQLASIRSEIDEAISGVLESGAFILGKTVAQFEERVAEHLGVKHAIGVNSGTDALVIALRAAGVGAGDEVITTPFSFFATAESICSVGAEPVFVDIVTDGFNIDVAAIEGAITSKTKAIIPVHLYGEPVNMTELMALAAKHNIEVVEDCAQSFGATYNGKQTGSFGIANAFSFFPTKNLGAYGDGGLITTNSDDVAVLCRKLRAHGGQHKYYNEMIGYNSRLDAMQAAVLNVKLNYIQKWNMQRRHVAQRYNDMFAGTDCIVTPSIAEGHVFHQYTIRLKDTDRDAVAAKMKQRGIATMVYYPVPQDQLPVFEGKYDMKPRTAQAAKEVLSLPIWPELAAEKQQEIADTLIEIIEDVRNV